MCRHSATRFDARLRRMGYDILPIQTPWVAEKIGREIAENPKEMLLLTPDGKLFGGADAYLQMARQFWWTRWLVPIGNFRPVHFVLEKIYQWIARHRHGISDRCGLK
jgi:predicted DCC family thiol-disulfide oxidoreductase YuxK